MNDLDRLQDHLSYVHQRPRNFPNSVLVACLQRSPQVLNVGGDPFPPLRRLLPSGAGFTSALGAAQDVIAASRAANSSSRALLSPFVIGSIIGGNIAVGRIGL
jgi:hypothetical protein